MSNPMSFHATMLIAIVLVSAATSRGQDLARELSSVSQVIAHRGASLERPECTLTAIQRAIEVGATAVEMDVRTSSDGVLFLLHDASLDRTTDGKGTASVLTIQSLKKLDAGSWFGAKFKGETIPTLQEALRLCRGKVDVVIDLKETGADYARAVANEIKTHGEPKRTIIGVRSVEQAKTFRTLLPSSRQLGLIPNPGAIEPFVAENVEMIRLWPRWLSEDTDLVSRVHRSGAQLHLNGQIGSMKETIGLLTHAPDSISSDDPARLLATLRKISESKPTTRHATPIVQDRTAKLVSQFEARQANQAVAVDAKHFFAITNREIGKYLRSDGSLVKTWKSSDELPLVHLNSGLVIGGKLYCAHSNYPKRPESSSVEVWDTKTLNHIGSQSFGIYEGSLTWIDWHDGSWWAVFAHYSSMIPGRKSTKDHRWTSLVRFDSKWRRLASWTFPDQVLKRFAPYSCSGGAWGPDGFLYCTGHDRGELYCLSLPRSGAELQLVETKGIPFTGQGIAWDQRQPGRIFGIDRKKRTVVVAEFR